MENSKETCKENEFPASSTKGAKTKQETPLMKQYYEIKRQHPEAVLLFRVGDFYETFGEDVRFQGAEHRLDT